MPEANDIMTVYNDNNACVQWSASVTNKGTKHMNLKENYVRDAHISAWPELNIFQALLTPVTFLLKNSSTRPTSVAAATS
eukprot:scaffold15313_cov39-Cyclotella_meneghiniana.AAC.3